MYTLACGTPIAIVSFSETSNSGCLMGQTGDEVNVDVVSPALRKRAISSSRMARLCRPTD